LAPSVPHGRYVELPETVQSYGHQTLAHPEVWKPYLIQLMNDA
jgi:homoserine O-acetyltransferase/O-succinyltransferase